DPAGARLSAPLRGPGTLARRLGADQARQAAAQRRRPGPQAAHHLRQSEAARHRRVLRAVDLRLREPDQRAAAGTQPGRPAELAEQDPIVQKIGDKVRFEFERTFMFYLPRICEHCLNPSCAASCPSGAIYKRSEDGIVLVDQDRCRGWRMCVSGCPYKKVYFNHRTGKAEKCTFCFPRVEVGLPTVCAETCVGRLRYIGLVLYDVDRVSEAAATPDEQDLY